MVGCWLLLVVLPRARIKLSTSAWCAGDAWCLVCGVCGGEGKEKPRVWSCVYTRVVRWWLLFSSIRAPLGVPTSSNWVRAVWCCC